MKSYQDINKETIDRWIEEGWEWGKAISHEEFVNVKNGYWKVYNSDGSLNQNESGNYMFGRKRG